MSNYIPAGRTSLVKKGDAKLHLQTEYAARPYPRITTTVLNSGRVLHKVEKKLDKPVETIEEQQRIENAIKQLHRDVTVVIKKLGSTASLGLPEKEPVPDPVKPLPDRIQEIRGVQRVFTLDSSGSFIGSEQGSQFKKEFGKILKSLGDLMEIFSILPGGSSNREKGVYEVERDKIYFVSMGDAFYFVTIDRVYRGTNYEQALKQAIAGEPTREST